MTLDERLRALADLQGGRPEEDLLIEEPLVDEPQRQGGGANETWKVALGGPYEYAYFKPMNGVKVSVAYAFGHTRDSVLVAEVAAWLLARDLGSPWKELVAPCVLRAIPEIDRAAPGSLSAERFGERDEELRSFYDRPASCADAAFFDALIGNQDRRWSNFKFDAGREALALIDHGLAFPDGDGIAATSIFLDWRHRAERAALSEAELAALGRVLDSGDLYGLQRCLDEGRSAQLRARAERMQDTGNLLELRDVGTSA